MGEVSALVGTVTHVSFPSVSFRHAFATLSIPGVVKLLVELGVDITPTIVPTLDADIAYHHKWQVRDRRRMKKGTTLMTSRFSHSSSPRVASYSLRLYQ